MATEEAAPSTADVWTVQRILTWTSSFLKKKGVESARLESELLLSHARGCTRIDLYANLHSVVSDAERQRMREMVQRRSGREPLAYIIGQREFYGRPFEVGQGVLIPRPETETLVDTCLEEIPKDAPARIIEVGFGSGCVAITIALQRPQCRIFATDISAKAMTFGQKNCARHRVADRVTLIPGDALTPFRSGEEFSILPERFDGLVSNPPYVRDDEWSGLQPEVGQHEPKEALTAGTDGLDVVRKIVSDAQNILRPGAFIAMELDPSQCQIVIELLHESGFEQGRIRKDLSGCDRIVQAVRSE
jgi:release factor glutamine methyltransferase